MVEAEASGRSKGGRASAPAWRYRAISRHRPAAEASGREAAGSVESGGGIEEKKWRKAAELKCWRPTALESQQRWRLWAGQSGLIANGRWKAQKRAQRRRIIA